MEMQHPRVAPLPDPVVRQLRSSAIVSDVPHIVDELVCNSLDANAKEICIYLDVKAFYIKVEDDGHGITRDDFTFIGEKHATSKLRSLEDLDTGIRTLGYRGQSLSCISDIALLEVTSRSKCSPHTYRKILKDSKPLTWGLSGQQRDPGTTVVVKDAFYNQPVRRKQFSESSHKVLSMVNERVFRLALIHPKVGITAINVERQERCFHAAPSPSFSARIQDVFGMQVRDSLQKIDFAKGVFRLSGYISSSSVQNSAMKVQYIYINRRFVRKTPLHKLLSSRNKARKDRIASFAFILNLGCPVGEYDITFDASNTLVEFKDWSYVTSFVDEVLANIWNIPPPRTKHENKRKREEGIDVPISDEPKPDLDLSKWRSFPYTKIDELRKNIRLPAEKPVLEVGHGVLSAGSGTLVTEYISKDVFVQARVLSQVDTKFIAAVTKDILVLIDQHAADERIRLEEFRSQILGSREVNRLEHPEKISLTRVDQELIAFQDKIESWGWKFDKNRETKDFVLISVPCIMGVNLTSADLLEYLRQLGETHGSSAPPPAVLKVLNFKACRGAIMFGDSLFPSECERLIAALKQTDLCFQCAHGRPTMVPIVNMKVLASRCQSISTTSVKFLDDKASISTCDLDRWHGIRRERSTLRRAVERLEDARAIESALRSPKAED